MENTSERGTLRELRRGLCAYTAILVGPMSWRHFAIASVSARTKLFKGPLEVEREGKGGRGDAVSDITHLVILVTSRSKKNFPAVNIFTCNNYYQDLFVREKYYLFIKERAYNMVAVNSLGLSIDVTHALIKLLCAPYLRKWPSKWLPVSLPVRVSVSTTRMYHLYTTLMLSVECVSLIQCPVSDTGTQH